jgi:hypothetical protein|tara:strand:- start:413 stop:547 length:135 start_codon:yes stop_codon:yes gene_type:complete
MCVSAAHIDKARQQQPMEIIALLAILGVSAAFAAKLTPSSKTDT